MTPVKVDQTILHGVSERPGNCEFEQRRRDDGVSFYCPNGHRQGYGKSAADREREKVATLERRLKWAEGRETHLKDQLQATEYQRRAAKGQLTKAKKRIAAGLCPCCKRNFQNLANHMAGQHPDYGQAEASA